MADVKITRDSLERARRERAEERARMERAFAAAARLPAPEPSVRGDADRSLRTVALGVAAASAFLPAAILADVPSTSPARNVAAVLLFTLAPAIASARAERAHEAEDMPRARFLHRFSPIAIAVVLVLTAAFPFVVRWGAVETCLLLQLPLALFLHVPRVRAIHLLVVGFGALASVALDDRALPGVLAAVPLVCLALALDRGLHVRSASRPRTAPEVRVAVVAASVVAAVSGVAYFAASSLLPPLERRLPVLPTVHAERRVVTEKARMPVVELALAIAAFVILLVITQRIAARLRRSSGRAQGVLTVPEPRVVVEPIDELAGAEDERWPRGPRRALVRRYLEHLSRLASRGMARRPSEGALDVVHMVAARRPAAREAEERLARAFHAARYSSEPVDEVLRRAAEDAARRVEESLER